MAEEGELDDGEVVNELAVETAPADNVLVIDLSMDTVDGEVWFPRGVCVMIGVMLKRDRDVGWLG